MSKAPFLTTAAVLLKRIDFGDDDLILTYFTHARGKLSVIAKSARKSRKRFCGMLDLFSESNVVCTYGRGPLPVLQEASLLHPFSDIRSSFMKTAYVSYLAEILYHWMEPEAAQIQVFDLLHQVLDRIDRNWMPDELLSIVFQMRLMHISGLSPLLDRCCRCHVDMDALKECRVGVNLVRGGVLCAACSRENSPELYLSKGDIKLLQWLGGGDWNKIARIRFSPEFIRDALHFLEVFVPYHLGKEPRSLAVLRQFRSERI